MLPHLRNNLHQETVHKRRPNFFPFFDIFLLNPLANFNQILTFPLQSDVFYGQPPPQVVDLNLEMGEEGEGGVK